MHSALVQPAARYADPSSLRLRRFTVEEYHDLIEQGFFAADERFELLGGLIVEKMPRNPPHDAAVNRARRRLEKVLPPGWIVRVQSAITTDDSEPEPDVVVVRGDDDDYEQRHPGPGDIGLLLEIANTTLKDDRGFKLQIYARARIQPYWILDLTQDKLEVYADPTGPADAPSYRTPRTFGRGENVEFTLPGAATLLIRVEDLLHSAKG